MLRFMFLEVTYLQREKKYIFKIIKLKKERQWQFNSCSLHFSISACFFTFYLRSNSKWLTSVCIFTVPHSKAHAHTRHIISFSYCNEMVLKIHCCSILNKQCKRVEQTKHKNNVCHWVSPFTGINSFDIFICTLNSAVSDWDEKERSWWIPLF